MGGYGSGRRNGDYPVEGCRRLDVRELVRHAGRDLVTRDGWTVTVKHGSWMVTIERHGDELRLTHRAGWEADEEITYLAGLAFTRPHYGGLRPWFRCPAVRCGRRCAVLYLPNGPSWYLCRRCYRLAYESTRCNWTERARRKAEALKQRYGIEECEETGWWLKPDGMHWRTFHRVVNAIEAAQSEEMAAFTLGAARILARAGGRDARRWRGLVDQAKAAGMRR